MVLQIWGTCRKSDLGKLKRSRLHGTAAGIIVDAACEQRSHARFNILNWDSFEMRIWKKRLIVVYKSLHNLAPTFMEDI